MMPRLLLAIAVAFSLAACGVKGDLEKPDSQVSAKNNKTQKEQNDPSKPPSPIGR
jgi:predicted small lipoprotein YifL